MRPSFSARSFCATPDHPRRVVWINLRTSSGRRYIAAAKIPMKTAASGPAILIQVWRRTCGVRFAARMSASVGFRAASVLIGSGTRYFFGDGAGAGATADVVTPSDVADAAADEPGDAEASADGARSDDDDDHAEAELPVDLADLVTGERRRPGVAASRSLAI